MIRKKALITISFGSTFDETRIKDIGGIEQALAAAFPGYDQYRAFTSNIIRKRLAQRGIIVDDTETVLNRLKEAGYEDIIIQPTHLLHGEEFEQKVLTLKEKFSASFRSIIISKPLIVSDEDFYLTAAALSAQLPSFAPGEGAVFMGHGTPRNNNKAHGRTYAKMQFVFDSLQLPVAVGTVEEEDSPNLEDVLELLKKRGYSKVHLYPLMVVAGDHANNDMCGEDAGSWKNRIEALGIATESHLLGLGRCKAVQALYIHHILQALAEK